MSLLKEIANSSKTGQVKANNKATKTQVKAYNKAYSKYANTQKNITKQQNAQLEATTNRQIEGTRQETQSQYDVNAINQEIQKSQISERMANMGLNKSGLNLTQQTALSTSRINADSKVTQSYNSAVNTLRSNLQSAIASNNQSLQSNLSSAQLSNEQNVAGIKASNATNNASIKSTLNSNAKSTTQKLISTVTSTSDKTTQAQTIFSAQSAYNLSNSTVNYLLNLAGISSSDYAKWKKDRDYLKKATL